ncbi:hypothetical protein [Desulfobulbus alkaliphilus]|uniref:hypothetical protein n=1 Tax=Desulfobulbus alkaliphilus TaxID=869814 RepID=UPI00196550DB|nr:hypothetical protein [Desulfobulbus alkaliphilus]MBM9537804.1 hypothetical protein [Desulfobulbus alkaliphilus]
MTPWAETAIATGVFLTLTIAFPVNAYLAFRRKKNLVLVLLLTVPLSWFVTAALLVLPPGRYEN